MIATGQSIAALSDIRRGHVRTCLVREILRTAPGSRIDALARQVPGTRRNKAHRAAIVGIELPVPQRLLFHPPGPSL
jgi:hypothetical protein